MKDFARDHLPGVDLKTSIVEGCMYTVSGLQIHTNTCTSIISLAINIAGNTVLNVTNMHFSVS